MILTSPYARIPEERWRARTVELVQAHPLTVKELVDVTLTSWHEIFESQIGGFVIGAHIFPKPQIMGFLLHELIPLHVLAAYPAVWRKELTADEKDIVYLPDPVFSTEIKTSSSRKSLFGNRSYAQPAESSKKEKSGYYLGVNFGRFKGASRPDVRLIRFGWLDHSDWIGQTAATGQQARLNPISERLKLLTLYELE